MFRLQCGMAQLLNFLHENAFEKVLPKVIIKLLLNSEISRFKKIPKNRKIHWNPGLLFLNKWNCFIENALSIKINFIKRTWGFFCRKTQRKNQRIYLFQRFIFFNDTAWVHKTTIKLFPSNKSRNSYNKKEKLANKNNKSSKKLIRQKIRLKHSCNSCKHYISKCIFNLFLTNAATKM